LFSLFSGWTINDNKLFCRESYVDGTAASIHLSNAGPLIEAMLESGACSLDSISPLLSWCDLSYRLSFCRKVCFPRARDTALPVARRNLES
jgi:hypothetical protein